MIELNKIYNMDCLEGMKEISDKSIDLIVTDPPYLISYKTNYRKNKNHEFCSEILNDNNEELIKKYIEDCYRILKDNTAAYIFCSSKTVDVFKKYCIESGFIIKNSIIWIKNNWTAGDLTAQFGQQYEIILLLNKGRKYFNGKRLTDVWFFDRISGKNQQHQNQKPINLLKQCIEKHSQENEIIFDGFMGAGSTAIACINTNRNYIGFELDKNYYNITNKRIQEEIYDNSSRY